MQKQQNLTRIWKVKNRVNENENSNENSNDDVNIQMKNVQ